METKRLQRLKSTVLQCRINDVGIFKKVKRNRPKRRFKKVWPEKIASVHSDLCVGSALLDISIDGRLYAKESE